MGQHPALRLGCKCRLHLGRYRSAAGVVMMPAQRPFSAQARRAALTISFNRLEICATWPRPADFCRDLIERKAKSGGGVGLPRGALLGLIAGVALLAGCGQAPEPRQK